MLGCAPAQELCARLRTQGAASVNTVTLLDKSARRQVDLQADYKGFEVRASDSVCMEAGQWIYLLPADPSKKATADEN